MHLKIFFLDSFLACLCSKACQAWFESFPEFDRINSLFQYVVKISLFFSSIPDRNDEKIKRSEC